MMAVTRSKAKATSVCDEPRNEISLNERLQKFLRERSWFVALILIPISLIYDVVAFGKISSGSSSGTDYAILPVP